MNYFVYQINIRNSLLQLLNNIRNKEINKKRKNMIENAKDKLKNEIEKDLQDS